MCVLVDKIGRLEKVLREQYGRLNEVCKLEESGYRMVRNASILI